MSMGLSHISAFEVINSFNQNDLKDIIKNFGEENEASTIAMNIIKEKVKKIQTTDELVKIIKQSKKRITRKN